MLAGDKLITVDDSLFVGKKINNEKVMKTLRGEKGTKVKLGILRAGEPKLLHYTITRGDIPVNSVDAKFIIIKNGEKIGFVRANKFGETTRDGIFASGDVVRGAKTVVEAVAYSKQVADAMDEYMQGLIQERD